MTAALNPTQLILEDDGPSFVGVKRALAARIGAEWKVGDRLPSIRELARTMGVGQNNVHRAVRDLVADGVLFSRKRLGLFVRALPNAASQGSADSALLRDKIIGLAVVNENAPFFTSRMRKGFQEGIAASGAQTDLLPQGFKPESPDSLSYWATVYFNPDSSLALAADKRNVTLVSTADDYDPELLERFDSISVDQYQGGSLAGRVLRSAGCRQVCYIGHGRRGAAHRYDMTSGMRLHGFEHTWGQAVPDKHLLYAPAYGTLSGRKAFAAYAALKARPDGIFAASDELAVGFIAAASERGYIAGKDFQIVGFDGQNLDIPGNPNMRLTSVCVPTQEMGRRAAQFIIQRAVDPSWPVQRVLLSCSISMGNTTCVRPS